MGRRHPAGQPARRRRLRLVPANLSQYRHDGNPFVGWRLDEGELVQGREITFIVNNAEHTAKAVFKKANGCGLGFELALLVPPLMWLSRRRKERSCERETPPPLAREEGP